MIRISQPNLNQQELRVLHPSHYPALLCLTYFRNVDLAAITSRPPLSLAYQLARKVNRIHSPFLPRPQGVIFSHHHTQQPYYTDQRLHQSYHRFCHPCTPP